MSLIDPDANSKRRETVDCFNCTSSRRPCDRTRHRCKSCAQRSDVCQGYPRELRWLPGVKSRGKRKDQSMSITSSDRDWQPATTLIHQTFRFRPARLQKEPRRNANGLSTVSAAEYISGTHQKARDQQDPPALHMGLRRNRQPSVPFRDSSQSLESTAAIFPDAPNPPLCDEIDLYLDEDSNGPDYNVTLPEPQLEPSWHHDDAGDVEVPFSRTSDSEAICSLSSLEALGIPQLLTLYDNELCTLPLTFDFRGNPFRFDRERSHSPPQHLLHALLATSMQHVSRMLDAPPEDPVFQHIAAYKHSAQELCAAAQVTTSKEPETVPMDTMLILFALDSLVSAVGPWKARLSDTYLRLESIGGVNFIASSSARFRAQLAMFVWWDCSVALLARSEPIFPASYYDLILSVDDNASWNIFTLSGVPPALFQYCRELTQLSSEKEQISNLRYAIFDNTRALELERCIREYTVGDFILSRGTADRWESIQGWHDYYNASNAWKYALMLYISRVLKWDRKSDELLPEITTLSRLVLDSIRCCRLDSPLQKQLLFPVFLAGSESLDSYSREFVRDYCEQWYQKCRYNMFREVSALLETIWAQRDLSHDNFSVWWGSMLYTRNPNAPEFLFG